MCVCRGEVLQGSPAAPPWGWGRGKAHALPPACAASLSQGTVAPELGAAGGAEPCPHCAAPLTALLVFVPQSRCCQS